MRVGICIPIGERMPERRAFPFAAMRDLARLTDDSGLDSIWVADHLFFLNDNGEARGAWESMSILGALAEATTRVELGPLVLCGPFRNAGMMAWTANTHRRDQRRPLRAGLAPAGARPSSCLRLPVRRQASASSPTQLEVIVPLLREGRVDYDGKWATGSAELRPPGPRPKGPPILIACTQPRMMSLTARWADRWNSVWYGLPTDEFRAERALLVAACEAAGRDPGEIEVTVGIAVADPRDDRRERPGCGRAAPRKPSPRRSTRGGPRASPRSCAASSRRSLGDIETIARAVERIRVA